MSRVLLVEDDQPVRVLLEHVLIDAGYHVDTAATLAEGRAFLETSEYDLLLVDGRLPDGSGLTLADQAEQTGAKALIITGYAFQFPPEQLGRFEFLMKPVRPSELVQAIRRILGNTVS